MDKPGLPEHRQIRPWVERAGVHPVLPPRRSVRDFLLDEDLIACGLRPMATVKETARGWLDQHPKAANLAIPLWLLVSLKWGRLRYWVLRHWRHNSIFVEEWEMGMCSLRPVAVLDFVLKRFQPRSVLDVGCGTGGSLEVFAERGLEVTGVEGSRLAISKARHQDRIREHDLERPLELGRKFDLVWSFEVAEHIRPEKADVFVDSLVRHGDLVVMSAAPPGQGGDGHFNEQPVEYWVAMFQRRGFELLAAETKELRALPEMHAANLIAFRRASSA